MALGGIEALGDDPAVQVIITDTQAAFDAAERLFPTLGRLLANGESDWSPLTGRRVVLMPTAGREETARSLADALARIAAEVKICPPELERPEGWSIASEAAWSNAEAGAWAVSRRILIPAPQGAGADIPPAEAGNEGGNPPSSPPSPADAGTSTIAPGASGEPPSHPDLNPPPEGVVARPKRRVRRLQVVGGAAVNALESIDPDSPPLPHELSESGIAAHFVMLHRDKFRTVHEWAGKQGACWMSWDGSRWGREPNRVSAMQQAQVLAHGVKYWDAARSVAELSKVKFESRKFIGAFLDLASYAPEFVERPEIFDADPLMLGTPAGTVLLESGKLIEAEREHYITRQTNVAPEPGPHPLFDDLIRRASGGESDIAAYLWNWLGYLCTGLTKEKAFLYAHGKTDSGKTTLATAIANILGNAEQGGYAAQCDIEMFTESKLDKGTDRLAHLAGARFAYASEMEEGKNFKSALLKLATGGDAMHGRFLYSEQFSFTATHKLWIFGNHQMHMKSSDKALLNRLHLLEYKDSFIVSPEERDTGFQEKLVAEYPAILASMIKAAAVYLECGGLGRPERISIAVDEYANSEDTLGQFIAECLTIDAVARTSANEVYQAFSKWAAKEGAYVPSAKRFGQQLVERGFTRARPGGVRSFVGFTVKVGAGI